MIAVFSISDIEESTLMVMEWIAGLGGTCVRINAQEFGDMAFGIDPKGREGGSFLKKNGREIRFSDIHSVWFRRWGPIPLPDVQSVSDERVRSVMERHMGSEKRGAVTSIHHALDHARWLSHPETARPNKYQVLQKAQSLGIAIPKTLVTSNKQALLQFQEQHAPIIIKCIGDAPFFQKTDFTLFTNTFCKEHIESLDERAFPVLVQKKIAKAWEIRTFFLHGRCHSMAIFSQENDQTRTDFRHYDFENPNRTVPYRLGAELEAKVSALMGELSLNTGSLDFMRGTDGLTYFLEVNPVGQFGMVSLPCNLHLEKEVAALLIRWDEEPLTVKPL